MTYIRRIFLIISLSLFALAIGYAADQADTGIVKGNINFCGEGGVAGMRIYVPGRQFFVITGDDGKFYFDQMPAGEYQLNYMYNGNVVDHKTEIFVFKQRTSDIGEIVLCDDPSKIEDQSQEAVPTIPQAEPTTPAAAMTDGDCTEDNVIKLPNGVGECKGGNVIVISCKKGFGDCDGATSNGCETDVMNDQDNCGSCGNECSAVEFCALGTC